MEKNSTIAEIQGLYGPINLSESCLQKIWERGDFTDYKLKTLEGNALHLFSRGRRNYYEGPDFIGAEITIDGQKIVGDIEVHLYVSDWIHHGHYKDANFRRVILHVVLFEPANKMTFSNQRSHYSPDHTLLLLPLLKQDIESYIIEEALMAWEKEEKENLLQPWLSLTVEKRRQQLKNSARQRWQQKVHFAQKRVSRWGWDETCHQACLEVLGYRRNRIPMTNLSIRFPLKVMLQSAFTPEALFETQDDWKLTGIRPANHPLLRLKQYLILLKRNPKWTYMLKIFFNQAVFSTVEESEGGTAIFRRQKKLHSLKNTLKYEILSGAFSGTRLDTLICDAFLPLGQILNNEDLFPFWFHWFAGDVPDALSSFQKSIQVTDKKHFLKSNGLNQGSLHSLIEVNK